MFNAIKNLLGIKPPPPQRGRAPITPPTRDRPSQTDAPRANSTNGTHPGHPETPSTTAKQPAPAKTDEPDIILDTGKLKDLAVSNRADVINLTKDLKGRAPFFISAALDVYSIATTQANKTEKQWIQRALRLAYKIHPQRQPRHLQVDRLVFDSARDLRLKKSVQGEAKESSDNIEAMLHHAIDNTTTDLHIHIKNGETNIYERIFGQLHQRQRFGDKQGDRLIHGIWNIYVNQQFSESEVSMDGRFTHLYNQKKWLCRVSYGASKANDERSMVIRLRDMNHIPPLDTLGYDETQMVQIDHSLRSRGLKLIIGAVNSGKSTTQTAICAMQPQTQKNFELSDQIEVELPNFVQLQLPTEGTKDVIALRLERLMRTSTRHDVDFISISEIRDMRTAAMASSMLLQGTSCIASIHGSCWADALNRLASPTDLAVSRDILYSESFMGIMITQTLIGVLCEECALTEHPNPRTRTYYKNIFHPDTYYAARYHNKPGCQHCRHQGVRALTLCAEVIPVTEDNRQLLKNTTDTQTMRDWMNDNAILTYHQHALAKVQTGLIDPTMAERKLGAFSRFNIFDQYRQANPKTTVTTANAA